MKFASTIACAALLASQSSILVAADSWQIMSVRQSVTCIHSILLPGPSSPAPGTNPKLLCIERPHGGGQGKYPPNPYVEPDNSRTNAAEIELFPPAGTTQKQYTKISKAINNPFCGGHAHMADGNILVVGGDRESFVSPTGVNMLIDGTNVKRVYTPIDQMKTPMTTTTSPWAVTGNAMAKGRWYPTVHTLDDGSQIIVGGVAAALDLDKYVKGERTLNPTYEYHPSKGAAVNLPLLEKNDPWNLYPIVQQMPISGKIFIFSGGPSVLLDPKTGTTTDLAPMTDTKHHPRIYPFTPSFVTLPLTQKNKWQATILLCGGTLRDPGVTTTNITSVGTASSYCSKFSPEEPGAQWVENFVKWDGPGKVMPDAVLMADGNVLFVNGAQWGVAGGDAGVNTNGHPPDFATYIYNPHDGTIKRGADFKVARLYHSGALLLPDGRVITTGNEEANWQDLDIEPSKVKAGLCFPGGPNAGANFTSKSQLPSSNCTDPFEYRIELYTPSYYGIPGKPTINAKPDVGYPATLTYGSNFALRFDTTASDVQSISFIRYASTTHSLNTDQRFVELPIHYANATHLIVDAPINATIAQPGDWMLFPVAKSGAIGHSVTIRMQAGPAVRIPVPFWKDEPKDAQNPVGTNAKNAAGKKTILSVGAVIAALAIFLL